MLPRLPPIPRLSSDVYLLRRVGLREVPETVREGHLHVLQGPVFPAYTEGKTGHEIRPGHARSANGPRRTCQAKTAAAWSPTGRRLDHTVRADRASEQVDPGCSGQDSSAVQAYYREFGTNRPPNHPLSPHRMSRAYSGGRHLVWPPHHWCIGLLHVQSLPLHVVPQSLFAGHRPRVRPQCGVQPRRNICEH